MGPALRTCALACKDVVALYLSADEAPSHEFGRLMLRAAAAIEAAAAAADEDDEALCRVAFEIVPPICRSAAAECRRCGFDWSLLRAAAACDRAAALCESRALAV